MSTTTGFHRLVLELGHGAADPATILQAAAFARLLDAELHALFVEDEILLNNCALPFAREISPLSFAWRPLRTDRLEVELKAAAGQARRHLEDAALATGVRQTFEVRRGDLALQVAEICVASDIMVVASPRRETTHGSRRWRDTAHQSAAAVLFLPPDAVRRRGCVVAVVTGPGDRSLPVARSIATRAREKLMVLALPASRSEDGGVVRLLSAHSRDEIIAALGDTEERLIVLTRAAGPTLAELGPVLAAARCVPVLVIEPD